MFFLALQVGLLLGSAPAATVAAYMPDNFAAKAYVKAKTAAADVANNPVDGDAGAIAAGKVTFETKCFACHSLTGDGNGPAAGALDPHPANFSDPARWAYTSQGTKHWIVMNGVQGTGMAMVGLTDQQAWEALAYIHATFVPGAK